MHHRLISTIAACILLLTSLATATAQDATAQDATPISVFEGLDLPTLNITATEDSFEVSEQVAAGRTLIVYENASGEFRHGQLFRLPDGVDREQAQADVEAATDAPPPWFLDAYFPGFVGEVPPDVTARAVVDLQPGTYGITDNFATFFDVMESDATPAEAPTPQASATVSLFEMGFDLPDAVSPGPQVWEITNDGTVPHEMLFAKSPEPITQEQLLELVMLDDEMATPTGGGPSISELMPGGGNSWLSPGATMWVEADLEPGFYVAVCFVYDPETGIPHVGMGMIDVFEVGE